MRVVIGYRLLFLYFFFFKQKTAYEMRISDWSSDVCSSDLNADVVRVVLADHQVAAGAVAAVDEGMADLLPGGKADVVPGLHHIALVSQQQRHLAFYAEAMLLLQQVIVPGCAAHAGRRPRDQNADPVVLAQRRARQLLVAVDAAAPELPFHQGE